MPSQAFPYYDTTKWFVKLFRLFYATPGLTSDAKSVVQWNDFGHSNHRYVVLSKNFQEFELPLVNSVFN
jgi:hypothetical protein